MVRDLRHHVVWAETVVCGRFLLFFAFFLLYQSGVGYTLLVVETVLLHELVRMEVPHEELTIVRGGEQASLLLSIVDGSHVVTVIVQRAGRVHRHRTALGIRVMIVIVKIVETPKLDGRVVGAGH